MRLRVASYNIHRCVGLDGREDAGRIARILKEMNADVVALQEVGYRDDAPRHVLDELATDADYPHRIEGVTLQEEGGAYGNAVLSRSPVIEVRRVDLSAPGREPRGALDLTLDARELPVQFVATHLGLLRRERNAQIETLLQVMHASTAPLRILAGDLNEWLGWGRAVRRLRRRFGRSPAPATLPAHRPRLALDRIWVQPGSALQSVRVHASDAARVGSDHLPVFADVTVGAGDSGA